jgi:hypothetical protein
MKARANFYLVILLGGLILSLIFPLRAVHAAATWVVNSLGDNAERSICTLGDCTLRSAINSAANGDTITFSVTGLIHLNFGGLTIAKNLTILGPGSYALTVSGVVDGASVFTVNPGMTLKLSGLSITHGRNFSGAGIFNQGNLTIDQCSLVDHTSDEDGGALYNDGGNVTITRSYFGENQAQGFGGAIENDEEGVMTITNSTFAANHANQGAAIDNLGSLIIVNSTIKDNGAFIAGGLIQEGSSVTLKNVLLADNGGGNCSGVLAAESSHNLSTDATCSPGFSQVSPEALALGPQQGVPAYFPLNYGSVAIDAGTNAGCPAMDETGKYRPFDGDEDTNAACDIGAYEAWPVHYFDNAIFIPLISKP